MQTDSPSPASPAERTIHKTGAQIIVDALLAHGVDTVFGYIGASVLPLFDRLYESPIRFVIPCHEQGGTHMADAYARASGRVGVVIATSGPGACNLVTGLATAMMDSIPLVAITGQVRTDLIGDDAFQEAPTTGITRAVTKHNSIVTDIRDLARTIYEAFHIASTGRPGPVLVDVPADLEFQKHAGNGPTRLNLPGYRIPKNGHARQISEAAEAINRAERPVLLAGGGVITANASQELRDLASKANLPVAMTLMGLGTMGFGLPAAIGTQIARPEALVVDIDGDHSFNMTMAELSTAVQNELPIKVCILNNGYMGMVRQWQELFYRKRYAYSHLRNPDYAEFARAVGAVGITVRSKDQVGPALEQMLREDKPCVVGFHVEAEENVWPMVPAGKSLDEMEGLRELENAM